jgi:hypothetical protein
MVTLRGGCSRTHRVPHSLQKRWCSRHIFPWSFRSAGLLMYRLIRFFSFHELRSSMRYQCRRPRVPCGCDDDALWSKCRLTTRPRGLDPRPSVSKRGIALWLFAFRYIWAAFRGIPSSLIGLRLGISARRTMPEPGLLEIAHSTSQKHIPNTLATLQTEIGRENRIPNLFVVDVQTCRCRDAGMPNPDTIERASNFLRAGQANIAVCI